MVVDVALATQIRETEIQYHVIDSMTLSVMILTGSYVNDNDDSNDDQYQIPHLPHEFSR